MIFTVKQLIDKLQKYPGDSLVYVSDNESVEASISEVFTSPRNTISLRVNETYTIDSTDDSTAVFDLSHIQSPVTNR